MDIIKLMQWNIENFFLSHSDLNAGFALASEEKKLSCAQTILYPSPHIVFLCETGGKKDLETFQDDYLHDLYNVHSLPGNSKRGIELAYLVRKDLPYSVKVQSYKDFSLNFRYPSEVNRKIEGSNFFERDCLRLSVGSNLDILGVHLKSPLDPLGIDPEGKLKREAEVNGLMKICREIFHEKGEDHGIILIGDFNGKAQLDYAGEFHSLYSDNLFKDCLEIAKVPNKLRTTFSFFNREHSWAEQLDYIFLSNSIQKYLIKKDTLVAPYRDEHGEVLSGPQNRNHMDFLPSDHRPILLSMDSFIKK